MYYVTVLNENGDVVNIYPHSKKPAKKEVVAILKEKHPECCAQINEVITVDELDEKEVTE